MTQLQAQLLTLAVEVPLAALVFEVRGWAESPRHRLRFLAVAVAMSLITHPFAWTLNQDLRPMPFWERALIVEALVVVLEGALLARWARLGWTRGYQLGLFVNAASFGVGLLISALMRR